MNAQYDAIARQYQRSKQSPVRQFVEAYTFMELLGDVRGLRVLDMACGEGFYSRRLRERGAAEVVGVDVSPAMIELARSQPVEGVRYVCADAAALPDLGRFDLVAAAYLLHYAEDAGRLAAMCEGIRRHLAAGGRFVSLNENPAQPDEPDGAYAAYGFSKSVAGPLRDGAAITYSMAVGRELFSFQARYFSADTYARVLAGAGLGDMHWHPLRLDPQADAQFGAGYFAAYLARPPVLGLTCRAA